MELATTNEQDVFVCGMKEVSTAQQGLISDGVNAVGVCLQCEVNCVNRPFGR